MNNIFYSIIGPHAGETVNQILQRKSKEIEKAGYSLWSAKIDKQSVNQVWNLGKDSEVFVLCKISKGANDPANSTVRTATIMGSPIGQTKIPTGIVTTYSNKNYQAYVVKEYIILDHPEMMDLGSYVTTQANYEQKSYKERFKCCQFQNCFGKLNSELDEHAYKEISVIMKLKYPFVVNLY